MKITIKTMAQIRNTLELSGHSYGVYGDTFMTERPPGIVEDMNKYFGKTIEVERILDTGSYRSEGWSWGDWMISKKEEGYDD